MSEADVTLEIVCEGGIKLPPLAQLFGPKPTSNEQDEDKTDGE